MKKGYIVSFILGAIIFSGVTVLATNAINANEVTYKNTTLDSALDTLYERSTYTEYAGSTTVTPGTTEQVLSTNNKLLKSNITISAIPSSYKKLSTATNFAASDLLTGKKAYNSNGELITGTSNRIYTEEEYQAFGNTRYNAGRNSEKNGTFTSVAGNNTISLGFTPKMMIVYRDGTSVIDIYQRDYSTTKTITISTDKTIRTAKIGTGIITDTSTKSSHYFSSIGTNVVFHTDTAGNVWTYYATE